MPGQRRLIESAEIIMMRNKKNEVNKRLRALSDAERDKLARLAYERCRTLSVLWPTQEILNEVVLDILCEHEYVQTMAVKMQELREFRRANDAATNILGSAYERDLQAHAVRMAAHVGNVEADRARQLNKYNDSFNATTNRQPSLLERLPYIGQRLTQYVNGQLPPLQRNFVYDPHDRLAPTLPNIPVALHISPPLEACNFKVVSLFMNLNHAFRNYQVEVAPEISGSRTVNDLMLHIQTHTGMDPNDQLLMNDNLEIINHANNIGTILNTYCKQVYTTLINGNNCIILISKNPMFNHQLSMSTPFSKLNSRDHIMQVREFRHDTERCAIVVNIGRGEPSLLSFDSSTLLRCVSLNQIKLDVAEQMGVHPACILIYQGGNHLVSTMSEVRYNPDFKKFNKPLHFMISEISQPEYVRRFPELSWDGVPAPAAAAAAAAAPAADASIVPGCKASQLWAALTEAQRNCFMDRAGNIVKNPTVVLRPGNDTVPNRVVITLLDLFFTGSGGSIPDKDPCADTVPSDTPIAKGRVLDIFSAMHDNPLLDVVHMTLMLDPVIVFPSGITYDKATIEALQPSKNDPSTRTAITGIAPNEILQRFLNTFDFDHNEDFLGKFQGGRRKKQRRRPTRKNLGRRRRTLKHSLKKDD